MPLILTKLDIVFDDYRVYRELQEDGTYKVYANAGYHLTTVEGESIPRSKTVELTGAAKTRAATLLGDIKTAFLAQELS